MSQLFVVSRPCYATRSEVMRATGTKWAAHEAWRVDRAIQSVSEDIDAFLHRRFYPEDLTISWDWPNYQYAYPWRIWLDERELATSSGVVITTGADTNTSTPGTVIPLNQVFFEPNRYGPPYRYIELDRSANAAWAAGPTPQRNIQVTGTFGYWTKTDPASPLAAAISSTTSTSITVAGGIVPDVGDMITIDSERMVVQDKALTDTTYTQVSGATTASAADNVLTVSDGTKFSVDETLVLDAEHLLVLDIKGNALTVKRAWDGSVLATHSGAEIYAYRTLTVTRGDLGTTAATHSNAAAITRNRVPAKIRSLCIAEASIMVLEETGGYGDPSGEGQGEVRGLGTAVADLWDEAETGYGRKARMRGV